MYTEDCTNFNKRCSVWTYTHEKGEIKIKYTDKIFNDTEIKHKNKDIRTMFESNVFHLQGLIEKSIKKDKEDYAKLNFK